MPSIKTVRLIVVTIVFTFNGIGCTNIDLLSKLEAPGGGGATAGDSLFIVSTNIPVNLTASTSYSGTVTFNRAANLNASNLSIDNGASISSLTTSDNITWSFTIAFAVNGTHNLSVNGATDSTGRSMNVFIYTFTKSNPL